MKKLLKLLLVVTAALGSGSISAMQSQAEKTVAVVQGVAPKLLVNPRPIVPAGEICPIAELPRVLLPFFVQFFDDSRYLRAMALTCPCFAQVTRARLQELQKHRAQLSAQFRTQLSKCWEMSTFNGQPVEYNLSLIEQQNRGQLLRIIASNFPNFELLARMLVAAGTDVNACNGALVTPLHMAASAGHEYIVRLLLQLGAQVNAQNERRLTPLHFAACYGHKAIVLLLAQHPGITIDAQRVGTATTPLHYAAERGDVEIVRILLDRGAHPESQMSSGQTPLLLAQKSPNPAIGEMLQAAVAARAEIQQEHDKFVEDMSNLALENAE